MYSLVMMTALTTAPSGPEFNGYFRDLFNRGGSCSGSCSGSSCSGSSCCGGGGLFHGRIRSFFSFGGSCSGSCSGACYGSCGGKSTGASCCGGSMANSCCGGAAAFSCGGGVTDFGSPYATPLPATYYYGPPVVSSYSYPVPVVPPVYAVPTPPTIMESSKATLPTPMPGTAGVRATVAVKLPADARLFVENQLLELTGGERTFYTPDLPAGREFAYTFKVEYARNGRTVSEAQRVGVAAGRTAAVQFDDLTVARSHAGSTAAVAKAEEPAKPVSQPKGEGLAAARITVKVPADGTLYIDGKKNDKSGAERQFTTPPLPADREFSYAMKVQTVRNGQPEAVEQKVVFRAGEVVTVDFVEAVGDRRAAK